MNIWLNFQVGGGASTIENILRSCTNLDCKPVQGGFDTTNNAVTSHAFNKQWHPKTKAELLAHDYVAYPDNVFTPNVPMMDMKGKEVLEYCNSQPGKQIYIGPSNDISSEFSIMTLQKVPEYPDWFLPKQNSSQWKNTGELERWQLREYISMYLMDWYLPEMTTQWETADRLGMLCLDTLTDIFSDFERSVRIVTEYTGCKITNETKFKSMCEHWSNGQEKIWQDWNNYVKYKREKPSKLAGDVVHEAMIQYHLRQQGVELKCWGLNTFPDSKGLKQYYE